ncbi:SDR family NAD(P)-dependent oxidoreductase [Mycobacterium sp. 236(2023)]|uniref:SDR family NAD(P)-dependent oxidoreductase n=1 Tax=Mycobacterium sp. 236(2023) TaxID=3038163 RepID=UPI002415726F|nr:SDR family NAD(P)-dependent oxidoreductase [Mycobacterium sp. 236(2023)]MDG4668096.1 SDR family NAD(P)-dependent oxidoreductase [Mycobacterium sp. 236(2023)]
MEIAGKKAVVVGGASGMGRATAQLLAERGASVAVLDRVDSAGSDIASQLSGLFEPVDITDFIEAEGALRSAHGRLKGLDIVVTTAGGGVAARTLSKSGPHDLQTFRDVLDLNAVATFNICRIAAALMADNDAVDDERGVLVNTSSIAAFEGQIGQVAYSAAKAAIAGMCLTMARDLGGLGIRVCAIAPSLFDTGALTGIPDEQKAKLVAGAAFPHRMGQPIEYARLAAAIIENPMLNGQCIRLDAGQRFGPR